MSRWEFTRERHRWGEENGSLQKSLLTWNVWDSATLLPFKASVSVPRESVQSLWLLRKGVFLMATEGLVAVCFREHFHHSKLKRNLRSVKTDQLEFISNGWWSYSDTLWTMTNLSKNRREEKIKWRKPKEKMKKKYSSKQERERKKKSERVQCYWEDGEKRRNS